MLSTPFRQFFTFTTQQRFAILLLLFVVVTGQCLYFFLDFTPTEINSKEKLQWLAMQHEVDSLKKESKNNVPKIYPFNPNFITDFKGYKLGMSIAEIDRLLNYRKKNLYVNSATEFQDVTQISDELLAKISPYFKFPDWVKNKKAFHKNDYFAASADKKKSIVVKDINQATQQDLMDIYGIGPALSERILKEKEKFGGFVSMQQMEFIWGLSPEVIDQLGAHFKILSIPEIRKIAINSASIK
ncbi:helix-hairpin-helix domain-containing protein [Flavobacterium sp.]|uniref:ComEA family DNA-binding protein n=1 Tax=Flavobacterium sp. TaxID=239 RepID=UPI0034526A9F